MDKKWTKDLLTGNRKRSSADKKYLENNGIGWKLFDLLLDLFHGKYGRTK